MSKKLRGLVLAGLISISLVGCSTTESTTDVKDDNTNTTEQVQVETPEVQEEVVEGTAEEPEEKVPTEYKSALNQAYSYSKTLSMSKAGIYAQLTSEYGGQFTAEAAQYAIDNIEVDWNENALKSAYSYQETLSMSPAAIYDQLISEYGGQFTPEEAQYAIDNLE